MKTCELKYDSRGLIPVVAQDRQTGAVLMLAYAKQEQVEKTIQTGYAHYFSRSRKIEWKKGSTSGQFQRVAEVLADCDMDAVLYLVDQDGVACHTGEFSCFHLKVEGKGGDRE